MRWRWRWCALYVGDTIGCDGMWCPMMMEGVYQRSGPKKQGVVLFCSKFCCEMVVSFHLEVVGRIVSINVTIMEYGKLYDS